MGCYKVQTVFLRLLNGIYLNLSLLLNGKWYFKHIEDWLKLFWLNKFFFGNLFKGFLLHCEENKAIRGQINSEIVSSLSLFGGDSSWTLLWGLVSVRQSFEPSLFIRRKSETSCQLVAPLGFEMQKHPLETSSSGSVPQNRRLGILIEDFLSFVPPFPLLEKKDGM